MDVTRYEHQHVQIKSAIDRMRVLAHNGIAANAKPLAREVLMVRSAVVSHLALEDNTLYPMLAQHTDSSIAGLARRYQDEMGEIAASFNDYIGRWRKYEEIARDPEGFRSSCNTVLRALWLRMQHEEREFHPAIRSISASPH